MPDKQHPSGVSGAFRLPFAEQIAFFRRKLRNLVPTRRWDDMRGVAHDHGFMVAGAMEADLLTDLGSAVDKAISEGRGIEEFRKDFRSIVQRRGWTGWTGEGSVKGEAWRVKVIYQTNSYTSYAAGRYAQLSAENYPLWVYRHGGSLEPRPMHVSWDGLALPPAHPFWQIFYPPSDWGCSCYVVGARSAAGVKRLSGDPDKQLPGDWNRIDPKTGEPVGVGKGWGYAPGASVAEVVTALARKLGAWDYQVAKAFMGQQTTEHAAALGEAYRALPSTADDARRYAQRVQEPQPDLAPLPPQRTLGMLGPGQAHEIERLSGVAVAGYDFSIDADAVAHVFDKHGGGGTELARGQRPVGTLDFGRLPAILNAPDGVELAGQSPMGEQLIEFRKVYGTETYHLVMAIRGKKRRTLALKTLFVRVKKK